MSGIDFSSLPGWMTAFHGAFPSLFPEGETSTRGYAAELSNARHKVLEAGDTVMREGDACVSMPFVISGSIRVFKTAETGREITLYRIERGQSCVFSSGCASAAVVFPARAVAEKRTEVVFIPRERVMRLYGESPSFRAFVLDEYAARMALVMEVVEEVAFRRVDERLRDWLIQSSASGSGSVRATHQEIASHLGTSREVVSRILKDWEARGAVELGRGEVMVLAALGSMGS